MADVQPEEDEEQQPGEEQQLMAEGHDANARGDLLQALQSFRACYDKGMRMEARISAANMCLKLGQLPASREYLMEAIAEYQTMLRQVHNERTLPSAARQKITELLLRKYRLSIDEAKERTGVKKGKEKLSRQSLPSGPLASKPAVTLSQTSEEASSSADSSAPRRENPSVHDRHKAATGGLVGSEAIQRGTLSVVIERVVNVPVVKRGSGPYVNIYINGIKQKVSSKKRVDARTKDSTVGEFVFPPEKLQWRGELHELLVDPLGSRGASLLTLHVT